MSVPILFGPFRGARIRMIPHDNLRKMFGLYEHELNDWLKAVLPQVDVVLDVGGNDGYFTFGCAAAFRRLKKQARIITFEPQAIHFDQMCATRRDRSDDSIDISIRHCFVGREVSNTTTTLDAVAGERADRSSGPALIKIDVEGAELEVIEGASRWLSPANYFLIEVHRPDYLARLQERFAFLNLKLEQRNQKPLPILGREHRAEANWWLVTPLS